MNDDDSTQGPDQDTTALPTNGVSTPAVPARSAPANGAPAKGARDPDVMPVEGKGPRVELEHFEGPLDLLLFLIREEKVEITDIPIARITDQYLETIGDLDEVDLDSAGEYLVLATTLMRIKAKMLIPRDDDEDDEDEEDPRVELMRRLMEYREFKEVAESLGDRQNEWRNIFARAASPLPEGEGEDDPDELADLGVSLIGLCRAFRTALAQMPSTTSIHMETESYSVDEQMDFIRVECDRREAGVAFLELFQGVRSRQLVITTFLALLEMIRQREIMVHQVDQFGEIWLKRATEEASTHE